MDLDNIKQVWKAQKTASFSKEQILAMRQKKSSSIAKWIFYISLAEFVFWIVLLLLPDNSNKYLGENTLLFMDIFTYVNYVIIVGFIYVFFRSYLKIKSHQPPKELLQNIFRMRKTVRYYIIYNISMILGGVILSFLFLLTDEQSSFSIPPALQQGSVLAWGMFIFTFLAFLSVLFTLLYFFYRLLYGFLLRRLQKNYDEIKELS